jgi:hypothetical protein
LEKNHPVDWWFFFKFNAASFPGRGENAQRDKTLFESMENLIKGETAEVTP